MNKILATILPLVSDTNAEGKRKLSIGRAPLLVALVAMMWKYCVSGTDFPTGVLTFVGMAMAYNGFSKSNLANGDGGNNGPQPTAVTTTKTTTEKKEYDV